MPHSTGGLKSKTIAPIAPREKIAVVDAEVADVPQWKPILARFFKSACRPPPGINGKKKEGQSSSVYGSLSTNPGLP